MQLEYIYAILFIAIIMLLRLRRQNKGYKASAMRIFRYPAVYIVLSLLLVLYTPSVMLFLLTAISIILGYAIGITFGSKSSVFSSQGKMMYKRSKEIFTIWMAAFVIRVLIEFLFPINTPSAIGTQSLYLTYAIPSGVYFWYMVADMLLAFSAGMLLGEALHIYKKYKSAVSAQTKNNAA
jgi:hypothetical protein